MGKKGTLLLVSMALALLWASGVALAATINGTDTVYFDKGLDRFVDNSGCEKRVPR